MTGEKVKGKGEELKRLTDYVDVAVGERLEGEKVELEEILGDDIKMTDFHLVPSSRFAKEGEKREFAVIQFEHEGKLCTTTTGGQVVVDRLKMMPKNYLPVMIKIVRVTSPESKRKYLNIE